MALETAIVKAHQRRERARILAELEELRKQFVNALSGGRPVEAEGIFGRMQGLDAGTAETSVLSAEFIAEAYAALAEAYAANNDYESAAKVASVGLQSNAASIPLREALTRYRKALDRHALLVDLRSRFDGVSPLNVAAARRDLVVLEQWFPEQIADIRSDLAARRSTAILAYAFEGEFDVRVLGKRMDEFSRLFPDAARALGRSVSDRAVERIEALSRREPLSARYLLDEMRLMLPRDPALERLAQQLPPTSILEARSLVGSGRLTQAATILERDRASIGRLAEYEEINQALTMKRQKATEMFDAYVSRVIKGVLESREARLAAYNEIRALWSDNPEFERIDYVNRKIGACYSDLAGEGKHSGATCYDLIADGEKGPLMVVVPPASGDVPFAIGKYEVSVEEFNRFCSDTGACPVRAARNGRVPVTGLSLTDAESYASWLSERATTMAGKRVVYRLPREREWRHAAAADGRLPARGINCRLEGGSSLSAGVLKSQGRAARFPLARQLEGLW